MAIMSDTQRTNEELVELYQSGDRSALDVILERNRGMIYKVAKKFMRYNTSKYEFDDLLQEGAIGIILAAERYKFDKSALFITYASYYIYQCISNMVNRNNSDENSLDKVIGEEDDITIGDTIADEKDYYSALIEELCQEALACDVRASIELMLNDEEQTVIKTRFGIGLDEGLTLQKTGDLLDLGRERIRQIEARSFRKLKKCVLIQRHRQSISNINRMIEEELVINDINRGQWTGRAYNF